MEDVRLSLEALTRAVAAVKETQKTDRDRLLGRVLAVARLLNTDAVLANAIKDLEHDALAADSAQVEKASRELLASVESIFFELGDLYLEVGSPWRRIVDAHPDLLARVSTSETLAVVLERVATPFRDRGRAGLTHEDLEPFTSNVAPKLRNAVTATNDPQKLDQVLAYLDRLRRLTDQSRGLMRFHRLCATASIAGIVARTRSLLSDWETRIAAGPSSEDWSVPDPNGIEDDLPLVLSRIETYLAGRRSRRLVLFRAKVYFEHFFCREARQVLADEEARVATARQTGVEANARRELELRRHLDRFIFQDGFFPITEASAGRGRLDMLLTDADAAGIRPLVVEIKQAARIDSDTVDAGDVAKAVDAARSEIPQYIGHLRARRGWEDIEPLVVVFHTAIEDVSRLEDENTILINIGTRSPSRLRA